MNERFGWEGPAREQLGLLIGSGIAGGVAHIMMTLSHSISFLGIKVIKPCQSKSDILCIAA